MQQQRMLLKNEAILRYFLGNSEKIDTIIMCRPNDVELVCYDQALYEAIGSLQPEERNRCFVKLTKFLENVSIRNSPRQILKEEAVAELRKIAGQPHGPETKD